MAKRGRYDLSTPNDAEFDSWWSAYPRKEGKITAFVAWNKTRKIRPSIEIMLNTLAWQKSSQNWKKDAGQFIPMPTTYLNQGRWADEAPPSFEQRMADEFEETNERFRELGCEC